MTTTYFLTPAVAALGTRRLSENYVWATTIENNEFTHFIE